jgi:shikimate dehydrogenase
LSHHDINGEYLPFAVDPKNLREFLRGLTERGMQGINVTLPHKESVMGLVDHIDESARRIGAVNTVVVQPNGELRGMNTDAFGFLENLKDFFPNWQRNIKSAVVFGAGGAARSVLFALQEAGVSKIWIFNRTKPKASKLALELGGNIKAYDWADYINFMSDASIVVNTTSLGMKGQPALDIDLTNLSRMALVYDIVYTPLETNLLKQARKRGNSVVGGLGMLLHQARPGFSAWFGIEPEVTIALRKHIVKVMKS